MNRTIIRADTYCEANEIWNVGKSIDKLSNHNDEIIEHLVDVTSQKLVTKQFNRNLIITMIIFQV